MGMFYDDSKFITFVLPRVLNLIPPMRIINGDLNWVSSPLIFFFRSTCPIHNLIEFFFNLLSVFEWRYHFLDLNFISFVSDDQKWKLSFYWSVIALWNFHGDLNWDEHIKFLIFVFLYMYFCCCCCPWEDRY